MRAVICDHCGEVINETLPFYTLREEGTPTPVLTTGQATTNQDPERHFHSLNHLKRWINDQTIAN